MCLRTRYYTNSCVHCYGYIIELSKASDKGYTDTVKELRRQGKKVVGIGEKKAPKELRDACSEFFEIK